MLEPVCRDGKTAQNFTTLPHILNKFEPKRPTSLESQSHGTAIFRRKIFWETLGDGFPIGKLKYFNFQPGEPQGANDRNRILGGEKRGEGGKYT